MYFETSEIRFKMFLYSFEFFVIVDIKKKNKNVFTELNYYTFANFTKTELNYIPMKIYILLNT